MEKVQEQTPQTSPKQETKEEKIERLKKEVNAWIDSTKENLRASGFLYGPDEEIENRINYMGNQAREHDRWVLQMRKNWRFLKSELEKILGFLNEGTDKDPFRGDLEDDLERKISNLY